MYAHIHVYSIMITPYKSRFNKIKSKKFSPLVWPLLKQHS